MNPFGKHTAEKKAFKAQLVTFLPRMRNFARGLVRNPDKADDLVQEACEHALSRQKQYKQGTRLDSWLYRIIYTRWIDGIRKQTTVTAKLSLYKEEKKRDADGYENAYDMDSMMDIQSALHMLPDDQRAVLLLVAVEGYSYSEAASIINIAQGTVASRIARARSSLAQHLNKKTKSAFLKIVNP